MKKLAIFGLLSLFFVACDSAQPTQISNTNIPAQKSNDSLTVSSHSAENTQNANLKKNGDSSLPPDNQTEAGGMAKPIDVSEFNAGIEKAAKAYGQNPRSETAKKSLAEAYFVRATALTKAAQYRAALGDYRKGLKLDPDNAEAKQMHDEIIRIFGQMNREPPKEGTEPPPLPFEKKKA